MEKVCVMVNGLPGKMAKIIVSEIDYQKYNFAEYALTGPGQPANILADCRNGLSKAEVNIDLIPPEQHEASLRNIKRDVPVYAIDFCKGEGVADRNAELYCRYHIPFVMGSTGAKDSYKNIERLAEGTGTPCVAAPNMDPQIVSFMDGIRYMAEHYPGSWEGYSFELSETHQADKINKSTGLPETSGTMKATLRDFGALASRKLILEDILSERNPRNQQIYWEVPQEWIGWHAYHIFKAFKPHDGVEDSLIITLKRHGGECYRVGAMKALDWLSQGKTERYFNTMFDVLKVKK